MGMVRRSIGSWTRLVVPIPPDKAVFQHRNDVRHSHLEDKGLINNVKHIYCSMTMAETPEIVKILVQVSLEN